MAEKKDFFKEAREIVEREDGYTAGDPDKINAIRTAVKELQNLNRPFSVTRLSVREVMLFSQCQEISKAWDWDTKDTLKELAIMKMSESSKSRDEIIKTLTGMVKGGKKTGMRFQQQGAAENE